MANVVGASLAFSVGGALMKSSNGFNRLAPSIMVGALFVVGAALMAKAVTHDRLSTAFVMGLGVEAIVSVGIGAMVLGERMHLSQWTGVALILIGVGVVRV